MPTMALGKAIDDLPDELMLKIFSHFTTEQLVTTVQHVSSHWKEVSQDNSLWKNRVYSPGVTTIDEEIDQLLRNMPKLKKFSPKRGITKYIIDTMCNNCRNIQQLEFTWSQKIRFHTLKQMLYAFPDLTHFNVTLPKNLDLLKFVTLIGQFNKLTTLRFTNDYLDIDSKVLSVLAEECPSLQHVDLGYCNFSDQDIRHFLEKKRNQIVSFSVRCYISTVTYIALSECINLEYLEYHNYNENITHTYMDLFSKLSKLKNLTLSRYEGQSRNVGSIFVKNAWPYLTSLNIHYCVNLEAYTLNTILRNCPGLKELKICDIFNSNSGFESIGTCSKLEKFTVKYFSISDESFEYISAGCHELKQLTVLNCGQVTDKAVEYISAGCPLLEELNLIFLDELTDGVFVNLFKCKNLRFLSISNNTNITGIHLNQIPIYLVHLETLHISWCENINEENLENLQIKMPQLKIVYEKVDVIEEPDPDIYLEDVFLFK